MSMFTQVEVRMEGVPAEDRPSLARVVAVWNEHTGGDHNLVLEDGEFRIEYAEYASLSWADDEGSLDYSTKWEVEGVRAAARDLTKRFPEIEVYVSLEWTGEEPSVDRMVYKAGKITEATSPELVPVKADRPADQKPRYYAHGEFDESGLLVATVMDRDTSVAIARVVTPETAELICVAMNLHEDTYL